MEKGFFFWGGGVHVIRLKIKKVAIGFFFFTQLNPNSEMVT